MAFFHRWFLDPLSGSSSASVWLRLSCVYVLLVRKQYFGILHTSATEYCRYRYRSIHVNSYLSFRIGGIEGKSITIRNFHSTQYLESAGQALLVFGC
jgi:hypothetical protein